MQNVCSADGYWLETRVNTTAVIRCSSLATSYGELTRFCGVYNDHPQWYDVQGECFYYYKMALSIFVSIIVIGLIICCIVFVRSLKQNKKESTASSVE